MPHQQRDFRCLRLVGDQHVINVFHQRFRHVPRHLRRGEQRVLITIFQLRQHPPLLVGFDLAPRHLIQREAFVVLQGKGIHQRVTHLQRAGDARLFLVFGAVSVFRPGQGTDLFLFAGRRILVIGHLLQQAVALVELHALALVVHCLQRFLAEFRGVIGNNRVKGRIHGAHLFLMVHRHIAAREGPGNEELRGRHRALQAVGVGINAVRRRALPGGYHALLRQPLAHVVAHIDLQHPAFGGELPARHIPLRPFFRG